MENEEADLHARARRERDPLRALALWIDLAARGNPDAPERLRVFAQALDPALRDPAQETLDELGLSHEHPMP